jgi:hypothetical protein
MCSYVIRIMAQVARISPENWSGKWSNTSWAPQQVAWKDAWAGELRWSSCREVHAKAVDDRPEQLARWCQQMGGGGGGGRGQAAVWRHGYGREGESDLGAFALRAIGGWAQVEE